MELISISLVLPLLFFSCNKIHGFSSDLLWFAGLQTVEGDSLETEVAQTKRVPQTESLTGEGRDIDNDMPQLSVTCFCL